MDDTKTNKESLVLVKSNTKSGFVIINGFSIWEKERFNKAKFDLQKFFQSNQKITTSIHGYPLVIQGFNDLMDRVTTTNLNESQLKVLISLFGHPSVIGIELFHWIWTGVASNVLYYNEKEIK